MSNEFVFIIMIIVLTYAAGVVAYWIMDTYALTKPITQHEYQKKKEDERMYQPYDPLLDPPSKKKRGEEE